MFADMTGSNKYTSFNRPVTYVVRDMSDSYACSFKEFMPFCLRLYYFSNFKDFNTVTQA